MSDFMNAASVQDRPGYFFAGWYIDEKRTKRINPGWMPERAFTLYGKWIPIPYPVTYKLNGGTNTRRNPRFVTIEDGIRKLYPAVKKGYSFLGWFLNGKRMDYLPEGIVEPIELEARFGRPRRVDFYLERNQRPFSRFVNESGKLDPFSMPKRAGYVFKGWYRDPRFIRQFEWDEIVEDNLSLYARWEKVNYQIIYDLDGGQFTEPVKQSFSEGSPSILLSRPQKEGYRFLYWTNQDGKALSILPSGTVGDQFLKAHWKKEIPEIHRYF